MQVEQSDGVEKFKKPTASASEAQFVKHGIHGPFAHDLVAHSIPLANEFEEGFNVFGLACFKCGMG